MEIRSTWIDLKVSDGTAMRIYVAEPVPVAGVQNKRGVIVLQEVFGVNPHIRDITERFAREGYVAVAPELFHRTAGAGFESGYTDYAASKPHREALSDVGLLADIAAAREFLAKSGVEKIAAVGFCMGGRAVFLASASMPLAAGVSFYGGGIAQTLLPKAPEVSAPLLLLWGGKDGHILAEHRRAVADALSAAGKSFTEVNFNFADHGFFCDARANYNPQAAALAWSLLLGFLKQNMG